MAFIESLARSAESAAHRLRVRSALNPMLWLTGIATPMFLATAYAFRSNEGVLPWLLFIAMLPVVVSCVGFAFFAFTKPEKLQSEEYQLRHETLQLIQAKAGAVVLDPASLDAIANPALPALPRAKEER